MLSDDDEDADEHNNDPDNLGLDMEDDITLDLNNDMDLDLNVHSQAQRQPPSIPPQLIARLLHEHFTQTDTRVTKEAMDVLCKYVEVFAQEAIARACFGKDESVYGGGGGRGMEGDFLEVSGSSEVG